MFLSLHPCKILHTTIQWLYTISTNKGWYLGRSAFWRPQGMGNIGEILHSPSTMQWLSAVSVWSDNLFLLSQLILLILPLDFALFCLSVFDFQFSAFVLLLLFHSATQDLHCYFSPHHLSAFSHDTPHPVQGLCLHATLQVWTGAFEKILISQHAYPFDLLFFCSLVFIFLSRLFSLLSVPSLYKDLGYVLSRVGADMALLQARRSKASPLIFLMLFVSFELRTFSIRLKIPCNIYVNIDPSVESGNEPDLGSPMHAFKSPRRKADRSSFIIHKYHSV